MKFTCYDGNDNEKTDVKYYLDHKAHTPLFHQFQPHFICNVILHNSVFCFLDKAVRKKKISTESSGKIIVWESETDFPGIFAPFSEIRSNFIETEHAAGRKIVHVTINPSSTVQINLASMKIKGNHFGEYSLY